MSAPLPANLDDARALILSQSQEIAKQSEEVERLRNQVLLLRQLLFAKRSEKRPFDKVGEGQILLFAEETSPPPAEKKSPKKKSVRKPLPKDLPRKETVIDVSEDEKICACCGGEKARIGDDATEQLQIIPAQVYVERTVRPKYACPKCKDAIAQKPLPEQPVKRSIAGSALLAYIIISKYADHIPLCRMERIFRRSGIDITRSNMSDWAMKLHELCIPLIKKMRRRIRPAKRPQPAHLPARPLHPAPRLAHQPDRGIAARPLAARGA